MNESKRMVNVYIAKLSPSQSANRQLGAEIAFSSV